jgi:hypothetical protein
VLAQELQDLRPRLDARLGVTLRREAKLAGLALREVKELLALIEGGQRGENLPRVREALEKNVWETEQKMELLSAFRDSLLSYRWRFEEKEDQGRL